MKVGILCEGNYDTEAIPIIIKRIVDEVKGGNNEIEWAIIPAYGHVNNKIESSLYKFYNIDHCDFVVVFSDVDKNPYQCKNCREEIAKVYKANCYPPCSLACITPHFEYWFIKEEDALKKIFGLRGSEKLPHEELEPKERIKKMLYDSEEIDLSYSLKEINALAAEKINFSKLMDGSYKEFKSFFDSIKQAISNKSS